MEWENIWDIGQTASRTVTKYDALALYICCINFTLAWRPVVKVGGTTLNEWPQRERDVIGWIAAIGKGLYVRIWDGTYRSIASGLKRRENTREFLVINHWNAVANVFTGLKSLKVSATIEGFHTKKQRGLNFMKIFEIELFHVKREAAVTFYASYINYFLSSCL